MGPRPVDAKLTVAQGLDLVEELYDLVPFDAQRQSGLSSFRRKNRIGFSLHPLTEEDSPPKNF